MGDDIDCCRRPTNLGKKDIKTFRGINQKKNPKIPSSNSDDFENFGTFKTQKNSNKKENSYLNSVYGKDTESKFPNFSAFEIEPVSEPLHQENISQPPPQYENAQYIESNSNNLQQNQIISDNTNYITPSNLQQNQIIQDTTNYIDTTEKYIQPQQQIITQNQFQTEYDNSKINNYDTNIQTNYIPSSTQDYNINYNSQSAEYISSNQTENISNFNSDQYGNSQKVLPTKYIEIQRPVIYADNTQNQIPITNYVESSSNIQSYQQYSNISEIPSTNNIEYNISPMTNTLPQYYESNNTVSYLPPKIETIYPSSNQYTNIPSNVSYVEQTQQIYHSQRPKQILVEQRNNQIYIAKDSIDKENNRPKKMKKKRKIIEYYSEDDEEEEQEDENNEEPSQSQSLYDEIKEQKKIKNKKIKSKNINKKNEEEYNNIKRKNKNVPKQKIYSIEDKENESDNIDSEKNIKRNQNKINPIDNNKKRIIESQREDDEFSDFQKEPEMIRESLENSSNNFDSIYEKRINNESNFNNKMNKKQVINLKDGNKIMGNFKQEEILDKSELAEKERDVLFKGQTLKSSSVEKKVETTGCQVPGFISNIFNKIF